MACERWNAQLSPYDLNEEVLLIFKINVWLAVNSGSQHALVHTLSKAPLEAQAFGFVTPPAEEEVTQQKG